MCDDEEINRALLERLLRKQGYEVVPVTSGAEAIATLRDRHVDPQLALMIRTFTPAFFRSMT